MPILQLFKDLIADDALFNVDFDSSNRAFYILEFAADESCTTLNTWSFSEVDAVEFAECMAFLAQHFD